MLCTHVRTYTYDEHVRWYMPVAGLLLTYAAKAERFMNHPLLGIPCNPSLVDLRNDIDITVYDILVNEIKFLFSTMGMHGVKKRASYTASYTMQCALKYA